MSLEQTNVDIDSAKVLATSLKYTNKEVKKLKEELKTTLNEEGVMVMPVKGDRGPKGLKGDKGDRGFPGEIGIQGSQGQRGVRGLQGETGPIGPIGPKGEQGIPGPMGLSGEDADMKYVNQELKKMDGRITNIVVGAGSSMRGWGEYAGGGGGNVPSGKNISDEMLFEDGDRVVMEDDSGAIDTESAGIFYSTTEENSQTVLGLKGLTTGNNGLMISSNSTSQTIEFDIDPLSKITVDSLTITGEDTLTVLGTTVLGTVAMGTVNVSSSLAGNSSGVLTVNANLQVAGNITASGNITANGNVIIGDADTDTITFGGDVVSHILPDADNTYDLGSTAKSWRTAYTQALDVTNNITVGGTVDGRDIATDGTKLDGIEASADVTDATNVNAAGAVMISDSSTSGMGFVVDEDNMSSDSATKVPTQQSTKAYVDTSIAGLSQSSISTLNSNVHVVDTGTDGTINIFADGNLEVDVTDSGLRLGGSNARVDRILDEDNMNSDSAVGLATQQSIKSYVDTSVAGVQAGAITANNSNVQVTDTGTNGSVLVHADGSEKLLIDSNGLRLEPMSIVNEDNSGDAIIMEDNTGNQLITFENSVQVKEILDEDDFASNSDTALATQKSIGSKITNVINNTDIGDFGSVNIDSPSDGQALIYDGASGKWIAGTVSGSGSITATQVKNLLVTVDGAGSSVDADLLDGQQGSHYTTASNLTGAASGITSVTVNSIMTVVSTTVTVANAGTTAVDEFAVATFRAAKYIISVSDSDDSTFATTEALVVHSGTAASLTQFGDVTVGAGTVPDPVLDADISGGNCRLLVTTNSNQQTIKVTRLTTVV